MESVKRMFRLESIDEQLLKKASESVSKFIEDSKLLELEVD